MAGGVVRWIAATIGTLALWTLWLALVLLLAGEVYIATSRELAVPSWVLAAVEQRLEASGIHAKFGRTSFDPLGEIFVEDIQLSLPTFEEPVAVIPRLYIRLDPWMLAVGSVEPAEIRVSGATWLVPAMLSPSGKAEEVVRNLELTVRPEKKDISIDALNAHVANVAVSAHGAIRLTESRKSARRTAGTPEVFARNYAAFCRRIADISERLTALEEPELEVELTPSESRGAIADCRFFAHGAKVTAPAEFTAGGLEVSSIFPLEGGAPVTTDILMSCSDVHGPGGIAAHDIHARLRGSLRPEQYTFNPDEISVAWHHAEGGGVSVEAASVNILPPLVPQVRAQAVGLVLGQPLSLEGRADLSKKESDIHFDGRFDQGWLDLISSRVHRDVRKFFDFTDPIVAAGDARFDIGYKFSRLTARFATQQVRAYHVVIDEGSGQVELDPHHVFAPEAYARLGENFAHGSYEQDFTTQDFRFLLQGQLRPLAISGWFGAWWDRFFGDLEFPAGPPVASVDVRSRWTSGSRAAIFVQAKATGPIVRGGLLDEAQARLFIRPGFVDGLETYGRKGSGVARGTFTFRADSESGEWGELDLNGTSSLDLATAQQIIGPTSRTWLEPFQVEHAPTVALDGRILHNADTDKVRPELRLRGNSEGPVRFYDFPLETVDFDATLNGDEVKIDSMNAGFAGGTTSGHARIWGEADERRLGFDYTLRDASLARAVSILEGYAARKHGTAPPPAGQFLQEKNQVRFGLSVSAEGKYIDPYSFHGNGNASVRGLELGEVRLLGSLSQLLRFTLLRFTEARANFRVEGPDLVFPEISVTGANSAIQGHGRYGLEHQQLDFLAKVYPFQESDFILQKFLAVALSPLSNAFEVKLTGPLNKPVWSLAMGTSSVAKARADAPGAPAAPAAADNGTVPTAPASPPTEPKRP